jgi:hypothetical protein
MFMDRTVKSYLRKADDAFRVHYISDLIWICDTWACGEIIFGTDKYLDGDDTVATASTTGWEGYATADFMSTGTDDNTVRTARTDYIGNDKSWDDYTFATAHTNYTGNTAGTFRTGATAGTYDIRGTFTAYEEDNSIIDTEVERRDDDDDATIAAANKEKETNAVGLGPLETRLPQGFKVRLISEENTIVCAIPWKDYSETNKAPASKRSKKKQKNRCHGHTKV